MRVLPSNAEVGLPREHKTVGIFYFLWLGRHGEQGPFDISSILQANPTAIDNPLSPEWGAIGVPHHWAELGIITPIHPTRLWLVG